MKPTIFVGVTDHLDPELQAMLLAQYSRSYGTIVDRIPTSDEQADKVKARMKQTYVNYGHKSVGQLGHTTIFFEGVSMLAAIAIEVSELFNGQESSTRYIPYDNQPALNFGGHASITHWQEVWRNFYKAALASTIEDLKAKYPKPYESSAEVYERTIKARAFDICGGILPAGFTTCVGFTGSFDVLNDHITWMAYHPLDEVRQLAEMAAGALMEKYPNAAYSIEKIRERGAFHLRGGEALTDKHVESYYYRAGSFEHDEIYSPTAMGRDSYAIIRQFNGAVAARDLMNACYPISDEPEHRGRVTRLTLDFVGAAPAETIDRLFELGGGIRRKYEQFPRFLSNALRFRWTSQMDFRSYRDMHRHRNGNRPLPLLVMDNFPHEYYLDNLRGTLREKFMDLFTEQYAEFQDWLFTETDPRKRNLIALTQQYAIPMAAEVPYYYECDLNQLLYMLELRTDKTVHQTVRVEMMAAHAQFASMFPRVNVYVDLSPNNFTLKRGAQTFAEVKNV